MGEAYTAPHTVKCEIQQRIQTLDHFSMRLKGESRIIYEMEIFT